MVRYLTSSPFPFKIDGAEIWESDISWSIAVVGIVWIIRGDDILSGGVMVVFVGVVALVVVVLAVVVVVVVVMVVDGAEEVAIFNFMKTYYYQIYST